MKATLTVLLSLMLINCTNKSNKNEQKQNKQNTKITIENTKCVLPVTIEELVMTNMPTEQCPNHGIYETKPIRAGQETYKIFVHFTEISPKSYLLNLDLYKKQTGSNDYAFVTSRAEKLAIDKATDKFFVGPTTFLEVKKNTISINISGDIQDIVGATAISSELSVTKNILLLQKIKEISLKESVFERYLGKSLNMSLSGDIYKTALQYSPKDKHTDEHIKLSLAIYHNTAHIFLTLFNSENLIYRTFGFSGGFKIQNSSMYLGDFGEIVSVGERLALTINKDRIDNLEELTEQHRALLNNELEFKLIIGEE